MMNGGTAGLMTRPKSFKNVPLRGQLVPWGTWTGMHDSLNPMVSNDPQKLFTSENLYPQLVDQPSVFLGRPGCAVAGAIGGAANKRTGQCVGQFTRRDGTEYTFRVVGGQGIDTYNWATSTWTNVVTLANLTTASITLSTTAHVYCQLFNDLMHFSDGVNKPWSWDGTSGAGGLVSLTNAQVLYGQPTVYYSKFAGIKNTQRNVWIYSEENDSTIGYEAAPYANTWQHTSTSPDRFTAIIGTNERLYYLRDFSTGAVSGAVTPEFQTDGTREGIDETIGSLSPGGYVEKDGRVFFLDARARPHVIVSNRVVPIWEGIQESLRAVDTSKLSNAIAVYDATIKLALFGVTEIGQTDPSMLIVVNPILNLPVSIWRMTGATFQALGVVKDGSGNPVLMHLGPDGYAYAHGLPEGATWSDGIVAGTTAIRHTLEGGHLGASARTEKGWVRADILFRADADMTGVAFSYTTPYGTSTPQITSVAGGSARYDTAVYDTDSYGYDTQERHASFGLSATGRWWRPRVQHEVVGERFGMEAGTVEIGAAGDAPQAL